jgi:hypothetical protein
MTRYDLESLPLTIEEKVKSRISKLELTDSLSRTILSRAHTHTHTHTQGHKKNSPTIMIPKKQKLKGET